MVSFKSYMVLVRVRNPKATINNKVGAIEQIFVFDPDNQNIWVNL